MKSSLLAIAAYGVAADTSGTEVKCIGPRAHTVTYDIQGGDTFEEVTDANISIEPEPGMNGACSGANGRHVGDKAFCFGANTDENCEHEQGTIPIDDVFECKSCFGGVTTDLYYTLETSFLSLKKVEVGLKNTFIRAGLEVRAHKDGSANLKTGSVSLLDSSRASELKFHVAGIVPVSIKLAFPTQLEYSLGLEGHLDATVGADLDIDLGDHFIKWESGTGFDHNNTNTGVNFSPVFRLDTGAAGADIGLTLRSSIQVDIEEVISYHVNLAPAIPSTLTFTENLGSNSQICLAGDVDMPVSHEADVHFTLLGHDHTIYHFGPHDLLHFRKEQAINKCVDVPFADVAV